MGKVFDEKKVLIFSTEQIMRIKEMEKKEITVKQAEEITKIKKRKIIKEIKNGNLRGEKKGREWRVYAEDLLKLQRVDIEVTRIGCYYRIKIRNNIIWVNVEERVVENEFNKAEVITLSVEKLNGKEISPKPRATMRIIYDNEWISSYSLPHVWERTNVYGIKVGKEWRIVFYKIMMDIIKRRIKGEEEDAI